MIEALLSSGADVDSFSYCGTPLHAAVVGKHDAAVKILLDHHADVSIFTRFFYAYNFDVRLVGVI